MFIFQYVTDTKAEADYFLFQKNFDKSQRRPHQRGKIKLSISELKHQLEMKQELVQQMQKSVDSMTNRTREQTIDDSDLDEYEDSLSTDDDDEFTMESIATNRNNEISDANENSSNSRNGTENLAGTENEEMDHIVHIGDGNSNAVDDPSPAEVTEISTDRGSLLVNMDSGDSLPNQSDTGLLNLSDPFGSIALPGFVTIPQLLNGVSSSTEEPDECDTSGPEHGKRARNLEENSAQAELCSTANTDRTGNGQALTRNPESVEPKTNDNSSRSDIENSSETGNEEMNHITDSVLDEVTENLPDGGNMFLNLDSGDNEIPELATVPRLVNDVISVTSALNQCDTNGRDNNLRILEEHSYAFNSNGNDGEFSGLSHKIYSEDELLGENDTLSPGAQLFSESYLLDDSGMSAVTEANRAARDHNMNVTIACSVIDMDVDQIGDSLEVHTTETAVTYNETDPDFSLGYCYFSDVRLEFQ